MEFNTSLTREGGDGSRCLTDFLEAAVKEGAEFHLFPPWVAEIGEIALIVLDVIWHHEIVEAIEEVGEKVEDVDAKIDALLAASPTASQLFRLKKSFQEVPNTKFPTIPAERSESIQDEKLSRLIRKLTWAASVGAYGLANWAAPLIG